MGRVAAAPLPLVLAGPPPPARRSAMEAFSSTRSGLKGLGCLSASSRAQRIALCVPLEIRTTRWGGSDLVAAAEEVRGGMYDGLRLES